MYIKKTKSGYKYYKEGKEILPKNKTLQSGGPIEDKKWLDEWYNNRQIKNSYNQEGFNLDKPDYLNNLKKPHNPELVDKIDPNEPRITGRYNDQGKILLTPNAEPETYLHELNHAVNDFPSVMRTIHQDLINGSVKPKANLQGAYKDKYDYFSSPDEVHSRIMVLRKAAGFEPNKEVKKEQLDKFIKNYKGNIENVNDLQKMFDKKGLLNLLNNMAYNPSTNSPSNFMQKGGQSEDSVWEVERAKQWGKYIDNPERRKLHMKNLFWDLMDQGYEPQNAFKTMKDRGAYGANQGGLQAKSAVWGYGMNDVEDNESLFKDWANEYDTPNQIIDKKQMGGQSKYTPAQWNKMNTDKGLMASPGNSINLSGNQNSKYMEFYDPTMFKPSNSNPDNPSEVNWNKIDDPTWKYSDKGNSPFINYSPPKQNIPQQKQFAYPTSDRTAVGFQPNYTTYKYKDGTTKYQDTKGNLYNNEDELKSYLEGLTKMQMGGALNKFLSGYAQKQINLGSSAPQGQSMDQFLTDKNTDFMSYITSNTRKAITNDEIENFKKFQMGGGPMVNVDNPTQPRQSIDSNQMGNNQTNQFYSGPFGPYGQQVVPSYVNSFVQSNPYNPYPQNTPQQPNQNNSRRNNNIADIGLAGIQTTNSFFNAYHARQQDLYNQKQMTIDKTAQVQYGNRGDYDINQGNFRPNQYTIPSYKKGGEYTTDTRTLGDLMSQGYEFEIIDE